MLQSQEKINHCWNLLICQGWQTKEGVGKSSQSSLSKVTSFPDWMQHSSAEQTWMVFSHCAFNWNWFTSEALQTHSHPILQGGSDISTEVMLVCYKAWIDRNQIATSAPWMRCGIRPEADCISADRHSHVACSAPGLQCHLSALNPAKQASFPYVDVFCHSVSDSPLFFFLKTAHISIFVLKQ